MSCRGIWYIDTLLKNVKVNFFEFRTLVQFAYKTNSSTDCFFGLQREIYIPTSIIFLQYWINWRKADIPIRVRVTRDGESFLKWKISSQSSTPSSGFLFYCSGDKMRLLSVPGYISIE